MLEKKMYQLLVYCALILSLSCTNSKGDITSPNGALRVQFLVEEGSPFYQIFYQNEMVLEKSELGFVMDEIDFSEDIERVDESAVTTYTEEYTMPHGKQKSISYHANEKRFTLQHRSGKQYEVVFRVTDDGVAFQYHIVGNGDDLHHITEEHTTYNLPDNARAWLQPLAKVKTGYARTNPSYEEDYALDILVGSPSRDEAG